MPAFPNIAATTTPFKLVGGIYGMTVHATFGGGSVTLLRLACDGLTFVPVQNFTVDGYASLNLSDGTYEVQVTTAVGVFADIAPVKTATY